MPTSCKECDGMSTTEKEQNYKNIVEKLMVEEKECTSSDQGDEN